MSGIVDHALPLPKVRDVLHGHDLDAGWALDVNDDVADAPRLLSHRLLDVDVQHSGDGHLLRVGAKGALLEEEVVRGQLLLARADSCHWLSDGLPDGIRFSINMTLVSLELVSPRRADPVASAAVHGVPASLRLADSDILPLSLWFGPLRTTRTITEPWCHGG